MTDDKLPALNPEEREALEREAGYAFVSDEEAHRYRMRKLNVVTDVEEFARRFERKDAHRAT